MLIMGPNRSVCFQLECFEEFGGYENMPKGDLFTFGVNPYNGKVVLRFQDRHENGCAVIEAVLNQLMEQMPRSVEGSVSGLEQFADVCDGLRKAEFRPRAVSVSRMGRGVAAAVDMAS